jgi:uncharacterized membrane protein HdeD (DUF308 family)
MFEVLFGKVKGVFNRITLISLVFSLLCVISGIMFLSNSELSNSVVAIISGIILIINGVNVVYSYFVRRDISLFNNNLIYGAFLIIIGILVISMHNILRILLAIYLIIAGIQKMNIALVLRKFNEDSWLITLVIGILFCVIAIVTILTNNDMLVKVTGIYLLGYGLINFINVLLLRRRSENFLV